ncbi:MAG: hypothetical protein N2C14_21625, partial [Planctomycetales bacterium]
VMDDLDGVLAAQLNIRSDFGALLDNVCDAIAHTVFVMIVGMHFSQEAGNPTVGLICLASGMTAAVAMILRVVTRINPASAAGTGTATNELMRHIFFILLVAPFLAFDPAPFLIVAFLLHAVSMLVPFKTPYLIRSMTKSPVAIGMVNVALLTSWLLPYVAPFVAASFILTYLGSFAAGGIQWLRKAEPDEKAETGEKAAASSVRS